jgi:uncharacterized 2Fe-2S/4Fe-4S cluster protein (DUF4445 family)
MTVNPIRKRHMPKIEGAKDLGLFLGVFGGWRPWIGTCPDCNVRVQGGSRKVVKDRLHDHRKIMHT